QPGLDATNWRAELVIRFGVILRKGWGGSRTWVGARAQSVLMSVWRMCWQQGALSRGLLRPVAPRHDSGPGLAPLTNSAPPIRAPQLSSRRRVRGLVPAR